MAQWDEHNHPDNPGYRPNGSGQPAGGSNAMTAEDAQAQMQEAFENARAEIDRYVSTAADFIRSRPVVCVAGAIAVGFLVGKLASRK